MAGIRGGDEIKNKNIKLFGEKLGAVYNELYDEIVWLHAKWLEYRKLYAVSEKQIDLLNRTASFFFYTLETVLREDILLHIARLTDQPKKGEAKRLSLLLLPKLVKDRKLAADLQGSQEELIEKCKFARDWRNRQIAHSNYALAINPDGKAVSLPSVSRQEIGEALARIAGFLNKVSEGYSDSPTQFDLFQTTSGAENLIFYLEEALKSEKRRRGRIAKGNLYPEDFE